MTRFGVSICVLGCFGALSLSGLAQASPKTNPWNGSWKADPSSLKFNGSTYSIATDADGYTVTRGGTASPKVVCDGKPHATPDGMDVTCSKNGTGYTIDMAKDGKTVNQGTSRLSADGKTLTREMDITPPTGSPFSRSFTSRRVSGGPGVAGVWKDTAFTNSQDNGILSIEVNGDTIAFKETDSPDPITCKLDGSETKLSDNASMAVKLDGPRTLKVTYRADGKIRRENTFVLSPDGKTIHETDVTPAPSPSTMSLTFHKS